MKELDWNKELFHCLVFDGALNVTKDAEMIQNQFQRGVIVNGVEHACSLIFLCIFKLYCAVK